MSAMSPLVTLFLNATTESQIFAGMIDGIKLVMDTSNQTSAGIIDMFDIWQSRLDVTFCDCRLRGSASSIVHDSIPITYVQQ